MSELNKTYRLPFGKSTKSMLKYHAEWVNLCEELIKKTGWTLVGYNPNMLFDTSSGRLTLTPEQVADLNFALNK